MISEDKNRVKHAVLTGNCRLYGGTYVSTFRLAHKPCLYLITNKHGVTLKVELNLYQSTARSSNLTSLRLFEDVLTRC
jgi:hypothetical protein